MQKVVFEEPYKFVPPVRHTRWVKACTYVLRLHMRRVYGISKAELQNAHHLQKALKDGHSVLLCPNHCRLSDPLSMGLISSDLDTPIFALASWHVFKQSKFQAFMTRRLGGFSIYREGVDRTALNYAINILTTGERPLVVYPEGVISRTNEQLGELMDGTAFMARAAAKKRAAMTPPKKVVVIPVGMRYSFQGDVESAVKPVLDEIENRLAFNSGSELPAIERIERIGNALLSLREIEYTGSTQTGSMHDRLDRLIDHILHPLEQEWFKETRAGNAVARVKNVRAAILPNLTGTTISADERKRLWKQLADVYLAQQLWFYPRGYLTKDSRPERLLETVERLEEDLTDEVRIHRSWHLAMEFGEPIEVDPKRPRGGDGDPLMKKVANSIKRMIGDSSVEPEATVE